MKKYPTKDEILAIPMSFDLTTLNIVKEWKTKDWKEARKHTTNPKEKFKAIERLLQELAGHFKITDLKVEWVPEASDCYVSTLKNKISLNRRLSIITALHELAHILNKSDDEKYACRWSIWLYMQTFPITFKSLIWKGHMLIRPESSECINDK